jgi:hypothetical protein
VRSAQRSVVVWRPIPPFSRGTPSDKRADLVVVKDFSEMTGFSPGCAMVSVGRAAPKESTVIVKRRLALVVVSLSCLGAAGLPGLVGAQSVSDSDWFNGGSEGVARSRQGRQ